MCARSVPLLSYYYCLVKALKLYTVIHPAELDLPNSGISRSVARISLPSGRFTLGHPNEVSGPGTLMMFYYSAQIHLGKILTRVHTHLYKVGSKFVALGNNAKSNKNNISQSKGKPIRCTFSKPSVRISNTGETVCLL